MSFSLAKNKDWHTWLIGLRKAVENVAAIYDVLRLSLYFNFVPYVLFGSYCYVVSRRNTMMPELVGTSGNEHTVYELGFKSCSIYNVTISNIFKNSIIF